jgi:hypothetical protein
MTIVTVMTVVTVTTVSVAFTMKTSGTVMTGTIGLIGWTGMTEAAIMTVTTVMTDAHGHRLMVLIVTRMRTMTRIMFHPPGRGLPHHIAKGRLPRYPPLCQHTNHTSQQDGLETGVPLRLNLASPHLFLLVVTPPR